jgi:ABC-type multidrug transport system fused ATPase/permease subunit
LLASVVVLISREIVTVAEVWKYYSDIRVNVEKLRETFDNFSYNKSIESWPKYEWKNGDIQIQNVSYGYSDKSDVFNNFSLTITWGKKTAFVWPSWSGKSTLIKLIAWYLLPGNWSIEVDWQDLATSSLKSFYGQVGYLTQEPSVFDGTILDNITYAMDSQVPLEKIKNAISFAKCDFVRDFPLWLDTEIGERGIRLSWWQRQRLAIAKIFLKDPKIVLLDEPTSSLDSFSEEAVTEAMHSLFEWRTVIVIAHRLQTVKHADDIIVLSEWKVIERGTHAQLIQQWWFYAKMLELQSWF